MPCAPRMTVRKDDEPGSGCRLECLHRRLVQEYRDERDRQHEAAVEASIGYATEYQEYIEQHPLPTFKDWLRWTRGQHAEEAAA